MRIFVVRRTKISNDNAKQSGERWKKVGHVAFV